MGIKTRKLYGLLKDMKIGDAYLVVGYQSNTAISAEVSKWNTNNGKAVRITQQQFLLVDSKKELVSKVWFVKRVE